METVALRVHAHASEMSQPIVILMGGLSHDVQEVGDLAREFGWSLEPCAGFDQLRAIGRNRNVVAVLFDANDLGLTHDQALRSARKAAPNARLIICHRFSDVVNWPELADAGAFHALSVPLNRNELRQSLGFVWSARLRRAAPVLTMRAPDYSGELSQLRDAS
jgi:DNA-binding NtrC family response regulator